MATRARKDRPASVKAPSFIPSGDVPAPGGDPDAIIAALLARFSKHRAIYHLAEDVRCDLERREDVAAGQMSHQFEALEALSDWAFHRCD